MKTTELALHVITISKRKKTLKKAGKKRVEKHI